VAMEFDILRWETNGSISWIEVVSDFDIAKARVTVLQAESPAAYIVFNRNQLREYRFEPRNPMVTRRPK
jgi:hypothetical protein